MSISSQRKTIVITGCSSGFGRITALHMAKLSWQVFATIRKEADRDNLLSEAATLGCKDHLTPLSCDITQAEQVKALAQTIAAATDRLDALLNNAGTAYAAPLELLALDDLRAQFEINVVAHVGITQALLPLLKVARGTIINVSSVGGRIAAPVIGAYAASKFALEAISDAWRIELAPFGVRVVVIEPAVTTTNLWKTSEARAMASLYQHRDGPYKSLLAGVEKTPIHPRPGSFPPQLFADTVQKVLTSRRPHARYIIPGKFAWVIALRQLLPDRLWDWQIRRMWRW